MPHEIETIFNDAIVKYREGEKQHGRYEPLSDSRDLIREAEAEILDAINYLAMFLVKLRAIERD